MRATSQILAVRKQTHIDARHLLFVPPAPAPQLLIIRYARPHTPPVPMNCLEGAAGKAFEGMLGAIKLCCRCPNVAEELKAAAEQGHGRLSSSQESHRWAMPASHRTS